MVQVSVLALMARTRCEGTTPLFALIVTAFSLPASALHYSSIIFCEAVAIYGVIVAIILQTKLEYVSIEQGLFTKSNMAAGYAIFAAGLTCGLSNLVCG